MKYPVLHDFLSLSKPLKQKIDAIFLFGSRARHDEKPDSDYDLLVIVGEDFSLADKDALYDRVMDILLKTGNILSLKIFKKADFEKLRRLHTPFTERVMRERVKVG